MAESLKVMRNREPSPVWTRVSWSLSVESEVEFCKEHCPCHYFPLVPPVRFNQRSPPAIDSTQNGTTPIAPSILLLLSTIATLCRVSDDIKKILAYSHDDIDLSARAFGFSGYGRRFNDCRRLLRLLASYLSIKL